MSTYPLVEQPTAAPTRKVTAIAVAGALLTTAIWALEQFGNVAIPAEVQGSLHTAMGLLVGYLVKDRMNS
jgi:hypothetical protein